MSFSGHRLLVRKPKADEAASSRNTLTFGDAWTLDTNRLGGASQSQCLEKSGTACKQIEFRGPPDGLVPALSDEERAAEQKAMGGTLDFFGVNATVQASVWNSSTDACDKWEIEYGIDLDGDVSWSLAMAMTDSESGTNLDGLGNFMSTDLVFSGEPPLPDRDHTLTFEIDHNSLGFLGNAVGCGANNTLIGFRIDYAVITLSPRSPIDPDMDELVVHSHDSTFVKYQGDGWTSSSLPEHERPMDVAFGLRSMNSASPGDSVEMTFLGTSVNVFIRSHTSPFLFSLDGGDEHELYTSGDFEKGGDSVFQASNLDPATNHTVKITIQSDDNDSQPFSLLGFVYTPSFTSLEEGQKLLESIQSASSNESSPTDVSEVTGEDGAGRPTNLAGPIAGAVAGGIALVLLILGALFWRRRRKRRAARSTPLELDNDMIERDVFVSQAEHERSLPMPYVKSYAGTDASQHNRGGYLHEGPSTSVLDDEPTSHSYQTQLSDGNMSDTEYIGSGGAEGSGLSHSASTRTRGVGETVWVLMSRRAAGEQPPPYAS